MLLLTSPNKNNEILYVPRRKAVLFLRNFLISDVLYYDNAYTINGVENFIIPLLPATPPACMSVIA